MRIVVDAMCAEFGGIRTYVEHLLAAWARDFADDELIVLVTEGSTLPVEAHQRREVAVRRPVPIGRPWAQTKSLRRAVRDLRPDAVLATLPSTTVLRTGAPTAIVVYDLRHELLPEQFSPRQRLLRRLSYGRGYQLADGVLAISQRSMDDLHRLHPSTTGLASAVAYLGADHVTQWPTVDRHGAAVAFAHHTNKNIDLVLDGWRVLRDRGEDPGRLVVCGVPAAERESMAARVIADGLQDRVDLAPFLSDEEFSLLMAGAGMIVFPTSFEGFGLPVVEGMLAGVPVVIGPEQATREVAGGHAHVLAGWTADDLADAVLGARDATAGDLAAAREHAESFTWGRTAAVTRELLQSLTARAGA